MPRSPVTTVTADVLVVGAGPAGIACSVRAAESGARVLMIDRAPEPGGQIWRHCSGNRIPESARKCLRRLARSSAAFRGGTSIVDFQQAEDGFAVTAESSGDPLSLRVDRIVLATGARELFIPFEGWTLLGVMGIGGTQALHKSGASFRGKRVAIAGSGPLILPVAASMRASGARVVLLAEQAERRIVNRFAMGLVRSPATLLQAAAYRARLAGLRYSAGTWVTKAFGTCALESVSVTDGEREWQIDADILCTGYGLVPNVELARLIGCEVTEGAIVVNDRQETSMHGVFAAGESTGIGGVAMSLVEGEIAGYAASAASVPPSLLATAVRHRNAAARMRSAFAPRPELRAITTPSTIVCRCEDVKYESVCTIDSSRQAKLYTRTGMGPCQGRICMPSLEFLLGWTADTVRPPIEAALLRNLLRERVVDASCSSPQTEVSRT